MILTEIIHSVLVLFDGEDDPDLHKTDSLLVEHKIWESVFYKDKEKL